MRWKQNHRCEQPSVICVVSVAAHVSEPTGEDVTGYHYLRCGVASVFSWDGSTANAMETWDFTSPNQFWGRMCERIRGKRVAWLYAHELMYTLWLLDWPSLVESGHSLISRSAVHRPESQRDKSKRFKQWKGWCNIDPGCAIIHTITSGKRINMVDVANYYRCSADHLAESMGEPKLEQPSVESPQSEWVANCYARTSSVIVAMTALMREWKASDLGNWQATAPSLAFSSYRHRFMKTTVVSHEDEETSNREREAFYDGRTQPIMLGAFDGPIYHLDVCGCYPSVMKDNWYPCECVCDDDGIPLMLSNVSLDELASLCRDHCVVARVKISTDRPLYPVRVDGRTIYPVGQFETTLCTPEVLSALSRSHLIACRWLHIYQRALIFNQWVDYWWDRRSYHKHNDNQAGAEVCKVVINSLVGKLAQRERHWVNAVNVATPEPWASWVNYDTESAKAVRCRSLGWTAQVQIDGGTSPLALVAASAHVSAYARLKMQYYVRLLLPGQLLYIANDALIVREPGYVELVNRGLVTGDNLGGLRLSGAYDDVKIYGARDYETDGKVVKAGLPRRSRKVGERRWLADLTESPEAAVQRRPDGTVHTLRVLIAGSEIDRLLLSRDDGRVLPPHLHGDKINGHGSCNGVQIW